MRIVSVLAAVSVLGCANTVYRVEGVPITPGGAPKTPCESSGWLTLAPTRADVASGKTGLSHRENGLGVYKVGEDSPESITGLDSMPKSEILSRKSAELEPYDRRRIIAAALGTAGLVAIGVGAAVFVSAFESKTVDSNGIPEEQDSVNGTKAGIGGALVGLGFGLGISGLVVNPSNAERTRANASRYVFLNPPDDPKDATALVEGHNTTVREACAASPR